MDTLLELVMLVVVIAAVYGLVLWAHKGATDRSANVGLYLLYGIRACCSRSPVSRSP